MYLQKYTMKGIVPNESVFLKNDAKVFEADGILTVTFDFQNASGSFHAPTSNFGGPQIGDVIDTLMNSGKTLRSIITSSTQDHISRKGTIYILGYVENFSEILRDTRIK